MLLLGLYNKQTCSYEKIHPTRFYLRALYKQAYLFTKFEEKFQPTRLFQAIHLLESWE